METEVRQAERRTRSGGRSARRALRSAPDLSMLPALLRNLPLCEIMDPAQVERIDAASMAILEEVGVVLRDPVDVRRWPTLADLHTFHKLAHMSPALHSTAHHIIEPIDLKVSHRHLH